jgi:hypothetical protein
MRRREAARIMAESIFSTYSTGENRVTGSILAVLRSLALGRTERLLGALLQESEFQLLHFQNQPARGGEGIPDAVITGSCRVLIETKVVRNAVSEDQVLRHLKRLTGREGIERLLVLTPDDRRPKALATVTDARVAWASFAMLDQAIDELLADPQEVIAEREAFLLRNVQLMLQEEDLLRSADDVVVVPAARAWPEYLQFSAYVCQPNRTFQQVDYMAFYADGAIQPKVPRILEVVHAVVLEPDSPGVSQEVAQLIRQMTEAGVRERGVLHKVFLLSSSTDSRTVTLPGPVVNDLTSASGRGIAFTQNQRYVSLSRLRAARETSSIVEGSHTVAHSTQTLREQSKIVP